MAHSRPDRRRLWIAGVVRPNREGSLHRQLGIPGSQRIPTTFLREIRDAPIGSRVRNPTLTGKRGLKVTRLLKKRAVVALTLRSF